MASLAEVTIDLIVVGQPECCEQITSRGWQFSFCDQTHFITAAHPDGGKKTIAEVYRCSLTATERRQIGDAIAMMLNGGNHKLSDQRELR